MGPNYQPTGPGLHSFSSTLSVLLPPQPRSSPRERQGVSRGGGLASQPVFYRRLSDNVLFRQTEGSLQVQLLPGTDRG